MATPTRLRNKSKRKWKHRFPHLRSFFYIATLFIIILFLGFVGCAENPPKNIKNSCELLDEKIRWYRHARASEKKWGVPVSTQLAIIYQESRFVYDAKTPRRKLLWVIPWFRKSSAYGYAQVLDDTWEWYMRATGNRWADRDDFADVTDFIGWYLNISRQKLKIPKHDVYHQYLAYHEGHGGYRNKSYRRKKWLLEAARKVATVQKRYQNQLVHCEKRLKRRLHWWWPF